jgi:hypothetical protein
MDPPPHEAEQVDIDSVVQCPEALFAMLASNGGFHILFLSTTAQVCRRSVKLFQNCFPIVTVGEYDGEEQGMQWRREHRYELAESEQ